MTYGCHEKGDFEHNTCITYEYNITAEIGNMLPHLIFLKIKQICNLAEFSFFNMTNSHFAKGK